ncbi:alpha/beta fold hydrolase [Vagococcus carniphilus]|uniref:Alpha/beta fold hydrolase n=1 Tax=Vagococcus carniphilus TaxID=218144 RepID=A0AAW8UBZ0_9ENTE|nr:alpha/beta fold hydrolase [Vagococcus carniphilus]MDT2813587.1 alpha/beta fold hydrolase [Vagococcus carniphilus]MDT2834767.1 alpha/beta fold hydrolase [Vagococcus carniphilus]MDT2865702.1 alpha/beta fold hydrolase [Vagococcus carniphilus]
MKKWKLILLTLPLLFILLACKKEAPLEQQQVTQKLVPEKTSIPTVFIHGYSGNKQTMKSMMEWFEEKDFAEEELLIEVTSDGQIVDKKAEKKDFKKNNPMIRLVFEDSKSHQWNQADWIQKALSYLKTTYQIEEVNLVGFSMGGISSLLYLETYINDSMQPKVNKVATIGAPFNDFIENGDQELEDILDHGPQMVSDQLVNYTSQVNNIPKETSFLLIGGQLSTSNPSDGTVPLSSSLGVYSLLSKNKNPIKSEVIFGVNASHSSLRKNEDVNKYISNFLWM